jgi:Fic family protein
MLSLWNELRRKRQVAGPVLLAALNLDFLCIHPFRDGNGRVSRLLLLLSCYQAGMDVGRYISLERLIEEHKERYYETLEQSSRGWHEGTHDPWPYIGFVLYILQHAYKELEERVGIIRSPRGEKTALVEAAIQRIPQPFRVADLQQECPGVSVDLIRKILQNLRNDKVECLGRGASASWRRIG